ncbi:MAG: hypothetical protein CVT67_03080 [Actinobacteria bacterium HGW-Actinobacteria-7]|jgi:hypothetical protein|nr:MAG: hypothetical protein CVT67_03080 [Actinobacteria bacterium HGW-Actinobacteria-7]
MPAQQTGAIWWALGVGAGFIVVIYFLISSAWFRKATNDAVPVSDELPEPTQPIHEYPEGLAEAHGKVPVVLKILIGSFLVFLVYYVAQFLIAMNGTLGTFDRYLTK